MKTEDIYPVDTVVRLKKTGQLALITSHNYLMNYSNFLNYYASIEGREGTYALYHDDIELECLPVSVSDLNTEHICQSR